MPGIVVTYDRHRTRPRPAPALDSDFRLAAEQDDNVDRPGAPPLSPSTFRSLFGHSPPVPATVATPNDLLGPLLRDVSRSFYLTLRVLPPAIRRQISLAYLLARATDTVADTDVLSLDDRLLELERLRERIQGNGEARLRIGDLARCQSLPAERHLLDRIEEVLACLALFDPADRHRIREVLAIITSGQTLDLRRFHGATAERIIALPADADLDDYTYRVAGCVGEFWTRMCLAHLFKTADVPETELLELGVRFGKGLQLVNILRDLPRDLRNGRCYIPNELLSARNLGPTELLDPANAPRFQPVYASLLDRADAHLAAGWTYANALPRGQARVRLACAWPILIGARTLKLLRTVNPLDPTRRVKVARGEVYRIMIGSLLRLPFPEAWRHQFHPAG